MNRGVYLLVFGKTFLTLSITIKFDAIQQVERQAYHAPACCGGAWDVNAGTCWRLPREQHVAGSITGSLCACYNEVTPFKPLTTCAPLPRTVATV
ncbi:hypothetical protein EVAR_100896_1 [Eumeta japonica]|uniref:Secreted protein n=1 Tax=Eumeta variegata TaxID=151549 RepID=A0A4C2A2R9_EUMVA|nr:hypothetical protein EVAR_100896_1 [Eumeta japonica]